MYHIVYILYTEQLNKKPNLEDDRGKSYDVYIVNSLNAKVTII